LTKSHGTASDGFLDNRSIEANVFMSGWLDRAAELKIPAIVKKVKVKRSKVIPFPNV